MRAPVSNLEDLELKLLGRYSSCRSGIRIEPSPPSIQTERDLVL
jgi:hypothetical protein